MVSLIVGVIISGESKRYTIEIENEEVIRTNDEPMVESDGPFYIITYGEHSIKTQKPFTITDRKYVRED